MVPNIDYTQMSEGDRVFEFEENGKIRRFIYDPDKMKVAQITYATTVLNMYEKMIEVMPNTPNEFQEALKKEALKRGLNALLIEVNPDTNMPLKDKFYPNEHDSLDILQYLSGLKQYQRLEVCKANFFILQGRISIESMRQFGNAINALEKEGVSQEVILEILKAIQSGKSEQLEILAGNSTPGTTSKKSTGKKRVRT